MIAGPKQSQMVSFDRISKQQNEICCTVSVSYGYVSAGAPKGGAETLFVALQELQAEAESLAKDAEQLARDAVAFEQPEPNFSQLASLKVCNRSC